MADGTEILWLKTTSLVPRGAVAAPLGGLRTFDPSDADAVHAGLYTAGGVSSDVDGLWTVTALSDGGVADTLSDFLIHWFEMAEGTWGALAGAMCAIRNVAFSATDRVTVGICWGNGTDPSHVDFKGRYYFWSIGNGGALATTWGTYAERDNDVETPTGAPNTAGAIAAAAYMQTDFQGKVTNCTGGTNVSPTLKVLTSDTQITGADPAYVGVIIGRSVAAVGGTASGTFKPEAT